MRRVRVRLFPRVRLLYPSRLQRTNARSTQPAAKHVGWDSGPHPHNQGGDPATLQPNCERHQKKRGTGFLTEHHFRFALFPAAPERFVKLNETLVFVVACLCQRELSIE
jgi:hypothetical protein